MAGGRMRRRPPGMIAVHGDGVLATAWKATPDEDPKDIESTLIADYIAKDR
jgi:hypothetical protein